MSDLISRQAAIDALEHMLAEPAYQHTGEDWYVGVSCAESELYYLPSTQPETCSYWDRESNFCALHRPSAQQERKKGRWVNGVCSQCGSHAPYYAMASTYYGSNFCPNCGADMRGDDNET